MLSRVADSLYWMARYLERAEHAARLIDVNLNLTMDIADETAEEEWERVIRCLGVPLPEGPRDAHGLAQSLAFDSGNRSSIVTAIMIARENARQVREQISAEMWEQLNRLYHEVRRAGLNEDWGANPAEFLDSVVSGIHLFQGITDATIAHGEAWKFIQAGRYLERASATSALVGPYFSDFAISHEGVLDPKDHLHWIALLKSCAAFEAFLKAYSAGMTGTGIAEFLLFNDEFPHSIHFSVNMLHDVLNALPETSWSRKSGRVTRLTGRLRAALGYGSIEEVMTAGIQNYLDSITRQCSQIHTSLYQVYIHYPIESAVEA